MAKAEFSPFIYSEDGEGNLYFEHQPMPFKLVKTVEGTAYGTLRLLEDQDGIYYIQIIEEGTSTTALKDLKLFAVDYLDDGTILDLFFDIVGNPHTIKERTTPVSFVDQYGNDYLEGILEKDNNIVVVNNNDLITYLEATFNRQEYNSYAKLMFSMKISQNGAEAFHNAFKAINAQQNMWWLDKAMMNNPYAVQSVENIFNTLKLQVQVWNGQEWVIQGMVEPSPYIMEEFLVTLDLEGIEGDEIKVRFVYATFAMFEFDSLAIDFTEDAEMIIHELDLVSAILNGQIDIINQVLNQNEYVELNFKDSLRLGFEMPILEEGYKRGFGVKTTGFVYSEQAPIYDPLVELMEDKTFEEVVQIIIDSNREELIADIPIVSEFYYLVLYFGTLNTFEERAYAFSQIFVS